jgi:multidrug efflux pump subunit AcrB
VKLPEYAIRNRTFALFAVLLVVLAGIAAFFSLGQLEEPDFTIKVAVVSTPIPAPPRPRSSATSPTASRASCRS